MYIPSRNTRGSLTRAGYHAALLKPSIPLKAKHRLNISERNYATLSQYTYKQKNMISLLFNHPNTTGTRIIHDEQEIYIADAEFIMAKVTAICSTLKQCIH